MCAIIFSVHATFNFVCSYVFTTLSINVTDRNLKQMHIRRQANQTDPVLVIRKCSNVVSKTA